MAVSSSRYTTTEGLDTSVQNMEESRSAFSETHPQTLRMPAQRTAQMPVPNVGPLPTLKDAIRHVRQVLATWRGMLEGMRASASVS